jgi:hypothetical protein
MPDLSVYSVTEDAQPATITVPTYTIEAKLVDGATTIADYTGSSALSFPGVLGALTEAQRSELLDMIGNTVVQMKAGLQ